MYVTHFDFSPFLGLCDSPYISVAGGCYEFLTIDVTFDEAREICQRSGGDLAVVDDCQVMADFMDYITNEGMRRTEFFYYYYYQGGQILHGLTRQRDPELEQCRTLID